jgi:hypothetical protein
VWVEDHRGRNESVRPLLYGLGLLALASALAYGSWLLLTPDYDGGRRPMGAIVLAFVAAVVLITYLFQRRLRGRRGDDSPVRQMSDEDRALHAVEREHRARAIKQGDLYLTEYGDPAANWLPKRDAPGE